MARTMFLAQGLGLESLVIDDITPTLLTQILAKSAVATTTAVLKFLHVVLGPVVQVASLLHLLVADGVQLTNDAGVE